MECHIATPAPVPAPVPEVPAVEKLLQQLVAETQSRPPPVVSPPEPVGLEKIFDRISRDNSQ